jgi:hypothetical protein
LGTAARVLSDGVGGRCSCRTTATAPDLRDASSGMGSANGSLVDVLLAWIASTTNNAKYEVLFGTSIGSLAAVSTNEVGTSFGGSSLNPQTQCFWRINPNNRKTPQLRGILGASLPLPGRNPSRRRSSQWQVASDSPSPSLIAGLTNRTYKRLANGRAGFLRAAILGDTSFRDFLSVANIYLLPLTLPGCIVVSEGSRGYSTDETGRKRAPRQVRPLIFAPHC